VVGVARHFFAVLLSAFGSLALPGLWSALLRNFRNVTCTSVVTGPPSSQISDGDCLPDTAAVLSRRAFSGDDVRVTAGFAYLGFCRYEHDSASSILVRR
jgi:hypothetical protein